MFFTREREKAASEEERIEVTKHAKDAYNSGFVKNILSDATYSTPKGKQELKPELDASKVKTYRDSSLGAAQEISNLNNTADDDLATLVSYGQHIQNLSKNEKKVKPEDENEEKVQICRGGSIWIDSWARLFKLLTKLIRCRKLPFYPTFSVQHRFRSRPNRGRFTNSSLFGCFITRITLETKTLY